VTDASSAIKPGQTRYPGTATAPFQSVQPPLFTPRPAYADASSEDDDAFFEQLLGTAPYHYVPEFMKLTKMSHSALYRAMVAGAVPYIQVGHRRAMTRGFTLRVMRHGLRPYSNQAVKK
jgi:hypothetical protein